MAAPCIPCTGLCVASVCDNSCESGNEQLMKITIDNLNLEVSSYDDEFNVTLLHQYFLTVKAVTGRSSQCGNKHIHSNACNK